MNETARNLLTAGAGQITNPASVFVDEDGELRWKAQNCLSSLTPSGRQANQAWLNRAHNSVIADEIPDFLAALEHAIHQEVHLLLRYEIGRFGRTLDFTTQQADTLRDRLAEQNHLPLGVLHGGAWQAA